MTLLVSAGEISGDAIASRVVEEIALRVPGLRAFGLGGPQMRAAGVHVDEDALELGAVGVWEAIVTAPALLRAVRTLRRAIDRERPDAALLVGNDLFNALLARWLRTRRIPTVSLFPPQVWLWGVLAGALGRGFDVILTSFPEEHEIYGRKCPRSKVSHIGHYLVDALQPVSPEERLAARDRLGLDRSRPVIALFPGSRDQEIRALAPCQFDAARQLVTEDPQRQFVLPLSDPRYRPHVETAVDAAGVGSFVKVLAPGTAHDVMRAADVLLATSGTTTLEAALIGTPMVALYRVAALSYAVVRAAVALQLMRSDTIALPNLILGEMCVPELKQGAVRADAAASAVRRLLEDEEVRARQLDALARVRTVLGPGGAFGAAAAAVATALQARAPRGARVVDPDSSRTLPGALGGR